MSVDIKVIIELDIKTSITIQALANDPLSKIFTHIASKLGKKKEELNFAFNEEILSSGDNRTWAQLNPKGDKTPIYVVKKTSMLKKTFTISNAPLTITCKIQIKKDSISEIEIQCLKSDSIKSILDKIAYKCQVDKESVKFGYNKSYLNINDMRPFASIASTGKGNPIIFVTKPFQAKATYKAPSQNTESFDNINSGNFFPSPQPMNMNQMMNPGMNPMNSQNMNPFMNANMNPNMNFNNFNMNPMMNNMPENNRIIKKAEEENFIMTCIAPGRNVSFQLLYKATKDGDTAGDFHGKCNQASSTVVLVETPEGYKFGGYTTQSWGGKGPIKDEQAFVFSLNKFKKYNVCPGSDAIGRYPAFGPCFAGYQIKIPNNCLKGKGTTFQKGVNYQTQEDFELTGGQKEFKIKDVEVYEVFIQ